MKSAAGIRGTWADGVSLVRDNRKYEGGVSPLNGLTRRIVLPGWQVQLLPGSPGQTPKEDVCTHGGTASEIRGRVPGIRACNGY